MSIHPMPTAPPEALFRDATFGEATAAMRAAFEIAIAEAERVGVHPASVHERYGLMPLLSTLNDARTMLFSSTFGAKMADPTKTYVFASDGMTLSRHDHVTDVDGSTTRAAVIYEPDRKGTEDGARWSHLPIK